MNIGLSVFHLAENRRQNPILKPLEVGMSLDQTAKYLINTLMV